MSLGGIISAGLNLSFPRVSGDEPAARNAKRLLSEFSPRERG